MLIRLTIVFGWDIRAFTGSTIHLLSYFSMQSGEVFSNNLVFSEFLKKCERLHLCPRIITVLYFWVASLTLRSGYVGQ